MESADQPIRSLLDTVAAAQAQKRGFETQLADLDAQKGREMRELERTFEGRKSDVDQRVAETNKTIVALLSPELGSRIQKIMKKTHVIGSNDDGRDKHKVRHSMLLALLTPDKRVSLKELHVDSLGDAIKDDGEGGYDQTESPLGPKDIVAGTKEKVLLALATMPALLEEYLREEPQPEPAPEAPAARIQDQLMKLRQASGLDTEAQTLRLEAKDGLQGILRPLVESVKIYSQAYDLEGNGLDTDEEHDGYALFPKALQGKVDSIVRGVLVLRDGVRIDNPPRYESVKCTETGISADDVIEQALQYPEFLREVLD